MRVNAVSFGTYPKQPNFNGLSKTVREVKDDSYYEAAYNCVLGQITQRETMFYYPFADESKESINKVVSKYTYRNLKEPDSPDSDDQITTLEESFVKVQKPLSITKKEWEDYKKDIETAKRIYEEKQEIARMAAIRTHAPQSVLQVEKELNSLGLGGYIVK